jgi:cellulose synthase operon protein C
LREGRIQQAEAEFRIVVRVAPGDAVAHSLLGMALTGGQKLEEANEHFEAALKLDPSDAGTRYNLALNQFRLGQNSASRNHLERILKAKPSHPQASLLLGSVLESLGEDEQAMKLLESLPDVVPQAPDGILSLARCYYRAGQKEKAGRTLDLLRGHSAGPEATLSGAHTAADAGDPDTASRLLDTIPSTFPDKARLGYERAHVLYETGRFEDCRLMLLATIAGGGSRDPRLYRLLAWAYQRQEQPAEAVRTMMRAIEIEPSNETGYGELAELLMEQRRYSEAYDLALRTVERMPKSALAYKRKGQAEGCIRNLHDAVRSLTRAVELDPGDDEALLLLAQAQAGVWLIPQASATFEEGIAKFPRNARFYEAYGRMLVQPTAKPDAIAEARAQSLLEKALALNPSLPGARYELGKLLLKQGKPAEALPHLEAAAKLSPGDSEVFFTLAGAYRDLERDADFRKALETYKALQAKKTPKDQPQD